MSDNPNEPTNTEGYQHEALDRIHVSTETWDEYITQHPFIENNPELKQKADAITTAKFKLYQAVANAETVE